MDIPIATLVTTTIQTSNEADSERSHQMLSNTYLWFWLVRAGTIIWFGLQFGNCCLSGCQDVSSLSVASTMSSKSSDSVSKRISWQLSCGFRGLSIFYVLQKLSSKEKITILVFRQKLFFTKINESPQKSRYAEKNPLFGHINSVFRRAKTASETSGVKNPTFWGRTSLYKKNLSQPSSRERYPAAYSQVSQTRPFFVKYARFCFGPKYTSSWQAR